MATLDDAWDQLEGIYAYDVGATDSGVHDEQLRQDVARIITAASEDEVRLSLSRWLREGWLSEESLAARYGYEDVLQFLKWFDAGDYRGRG